MKKIVLVTGKPEQQEEEAKAATSHDQWLMSMKWLMLVVAMEREMGKNKIVLDQTNNEDAVVLSLMTFRK